MLSSKYSHGSTVFVKNDLFSNHDRILQNKTIQAITNAVGSFALAKETEWDYIPEEFENEVESISLGIDGTCMLMRDDGWRKAMTGTISLYDKEGKRLHTSYLAAPPEYGKNKFLERIEEKINKTKFFFNDVSNVIGLADGARENWNFLKYHTNLQVIDFYHVKEYLGSYAQVVFEDNDEREIWLTESCHNLKHKKGAAARLIKVFEEKLKTAKNKKSRDVIQKTLTYFKNNKKRMIYSDAINLNLLIGSGVTEAACKVIVKERMCQPGMRWKNEGAHITLKLRSLKQTPGNWDFFWSKVDKYGFSMAA